MDYVAPDHPGTRPQPIDDPPPTPPERPLPACRSPDWREQRWTCRSQVWEQR